MIAPFAEARDRLDTITGVGKRAAECIIAEIGVDMSRFPDRRPPGLVGGDVPGQQHHRRQTPVRQDQQGRPLARRDPQRVRLGRGPQPQHLPRPPSSGDSPDASARRRPPSPSATPSSSSPGTSSPTTSTTTISGDDWFTRGTDPERRKNSLIRQLQALGYAVTLRPAA